MQYLLAIHMDTTELGEFGPYSSKEELEQAFADTDAFNKRLQSGGYWVFAGGLQPARTAQVIDATNGEMVNNTSGPYLDQSEHLSGMWIIDVPNEDTALELAEAASRACRNAVEVRPFQGM